MPLPVICERSTPCSRTSIRTAGRDVIAAGLPVPAGRLTRPRPRRLRRGFREGILDRSHGGLRSRRCLRGCDLRCGRRGLRLRLRSLRPRCGRLRRRSRDPCHFLRLRLGRGIRCGGAGVDGTDRLSNRHHRALRGDQLGHHAVGRRGDLGVHLVGDHLGDRLVFCDCVAGVLEPPGDGSFGDALSELRHRDRQCHFASFLVFAFSTLRARGASPRPCSV